MTGSGSRLPQLFLRHVRRSGIIRRGDVLVVALSGGRDSVTLAHLLRFTPGLPRLTLVAAHVDHGMRPDSEGDAAWVRGLAAAWSLNHRATRLDPPSASEEEARRRRYAFLEEVRVSEGAVVVATAHHADDQAETVLFRAARGSGLAGLQGIRERKPGVWRPLLPFSGEELRAYADAMRLSWREDPTNREPLPRNVLRREILPRLGQAVAPGASRALARLARLARDDEEGWESLVPGLLEGADLRREPAGWSLNRAALESLHPAVRARLLRALARRVDLTPSEAGTRLAVEFTSSGASGRWIPMGGNVRLVRDLDRLRIERVVEHPPDENVTIPGPGEGSGRALLGGRGFLVTWSRTTDASEGEGVFGAAGVRFPLTVRGPRPGDRMAVEYGTKKVKKLLLEARVPSGERRRTPLLVDDEGVVLWVAGVRRARRRDGGGQGRIFVRITDAESD
ncbi:MAG: tRNA lysidine(34) synthetase TilS [Gemmatimonadota bacterium]